MTHGGSAHPIGPVAQVAARLQDRADTLKPEQRHRAAFIETYCRTTIAVGQAVAAGTFEDGEWVERWDVVFAELFIAAHDADVRGLTSQAPRPWRLSFEAPRSLPALRRVLLGMNAHVNYDLPQSLLAVITDDEFDDPELMALRRRDHERIDGVLASRVGAEDKVLAAEGRTIQDRVLQPFNRSGTKRFLREARQKVWHNTMELQRARLASPIEYDVRLGELEVLSAAKIADLLAPGPVLLRLAVAGFGVTLPPPA
jgi:Family of unknown function (DUF5995)